MYELVYKQEICGKYQWDNDPNAKCKQRVEGA